VKPIPAESTEREQRAVEPRPAQAEPAAPPLRSPGWTPATVVALQRAGAGNHAISRALARSRSTATPTKGTRPTKTVGTPSSSAPPPKAKDQRITDAIAKVEHMVAEVEGYKQEAQTIAGAAPPAQAERMRGVQERIAKFAGDIAQHLATAQATDTLQKAEKVVGKATSAAAFAKAALDDIRPQAAPEAPSQATKPNHKNKSKKTRAVKSAQRRETAVRAADALIERLKNESAPISTARLVELKAAVGAAEPLKIGELESETADVDALRDLFLQVRRYYERKKTGLGQELKDAFEDLKGELGAAKLSNAEKQQLLSGFYTDVREFVGDEHERFTAMVQAGSATKAEEQSDTARVKGLKAEGRWSQHGREIPSKARGSLAGTDLTNVDAILTAFTANAATSPLGAGAKWRERYWNAQGHLPGRTTGTRYKEFYVDPVIGENQWGVRRLVRDSNNDRWYYSDTHFGETPSGSTPFYLFQT
jgi:guanyl-specific ribonuclease Sa